jgi:hypothetical protein
MSRSSAGWNKLVFPAVNDTADDGVQKLANPISRVTGAQQDLHDAVEVGEVFRMQVVTIQRGTTAPGRGPGRP